MAKILWNVHLYLPRHSAGAELMCHQINKYLMTKGHEVRVINNQVARYNISVPYTFEGVEVMGMTGHLEQLMWADVLLTHLEYTHPTVQFGKIIKRPVIHFVHNDTPYSSVMNSPMPIGVVYNSQWIADKLKYEQQSIVFPPPCDYDYYNVRTKPGEFITLINCNENKGGKVLCELAKAMPDRKFMAVTGSYEEQFIPRLPNVTIVDKMVDIRPVYENTRMLIMPSDYESWGRTATEAMCNGIPVICTATPGLLENCGKAGTFIGEYEEYTDERGHKRGRTKGRNDVSKWVAAIKSFDNPKKYQKFSNLGRERAQELRPAVGLAKLEDFILNATRTNFK